VGLSNVSCAYYALSTETDAVQIVPLSTRGRLHSLWYNPVSDAASGPGAHILTLKDGSSSGTLIYEELVGGWLFSNASDIYYGFGPSPTMIPDHGILFTDGLNAKFAKSATPFNTTPNTGMYSITVTYSGGPAEING